MYKIYSLLTAPISDFRKDLKRYLDKVTSNFETLVINRGKDNGVVIMSLSEYNSLCAKNDELSSRKNEDRLDKAILNVRKGDTFSKSLLEE
ncbi:MAG: antitoxin YefM [Luteibaculaceae bacterium]